jgi:hypothetical protein
MAKMHSYGAENQAFRSTVLRWIAVATFVFVTVVLADSFKKSSFDFSFLKTSLFSALFSAGSSAGIVTITFFIIYQVYDKFIWKINPLETVPDLSGTWIGMGSNPYFEHPRLELMRIKQHWSTILITVEVYEGNNVDPTKASSWFDNAGTIDKTKVVRMGIEYSTIALITEYESGHGDLIFNYQHRGEAGGQDSFEGAMFLQYERTGEFHELKGNYINRKRGKYFNKKSKSEENFEGLVGRVVFRRVSPKLIETKEALQEVKNPEVLVHLYRDVTAQIQGSSKASKNNFGTILFCGVSAITLITLIVKTCTTLLL